MAFMADSPMLLAWSVTARIWAWKNSDWIRIASCGSLARRAGDEPGPFGTCVMPDAAKPYVANGASGECELGYSRLACGYVGGEADAGSDSCHHGTTRTRTYDMDAAFMQFQ